MTAATDYIEVLPSELVPHVLSFLSGFDLRRLLQVNKRFYSQFLGANSDCWTSHTPSAMRVGPYKWRTLAKVGWTYVRPKSTFSRRFDPDATRRRLEHHRAKQARQAKQRATREQALLADAKRHYFESVSVRFPGLLERKDDAREARRWIEGRVVLPERNLRDKWSRDSFSFDLWMALLPASSTDEDEGGGCTVGGVVFSAQSSRWIEGDAASPMAAQFVHVDELGGLYCSVASGVKRALATLSFSRWYHLALTFDRSTSHSDSYSAVQCVFLDGELIDTQHGALQLPDHWSQLQTSQLGTGFMDADAVGAPEVHTHRTSFLRGLTWLKDALHPWRSANPQFRGDYTFRGLLDEFRIWRGVLTAEDVGHLMCGHAHQVSREVTCDWSLMADADYRCFYGDLWAVECTRPTERVCEGVQKAFRLWTMDELRSIPTPKG